MVGFPLASSESRIVAEHLRDHQSQKAAESEKPLHELKGFACGEIEREVGKNGTEQQNTSNDT